MVSQVIIGPLTNEVESVCTPMFVFLKKIFYSVQLGLRYVRRDTPVTTTWR